MNKIYYLSTCSTCTRIIKTLEITPANFEMQDIKSTAISAEQLQDMYALGGSYEALFSRRAMKYKSMGLANQTLDENNYRDLILEEYTFLKRPVIIINKEIFIGNSAKVVDEVRGILNT